MAQPSTSFNLDYLREIIGDDPEAIAELLETFLEHTPEQLSELREALKSSDLIQLKRTAHSMKAPVRMLGMDEAAELLAQTEELAAGGHSAAEVGPVLHEFLHLFERELPAVEEALRELRSVS